MTSLATFDFEGYEVCCVGSPDQPKWVARDITN
jgi:hypothetical protein